jgi:hypothetical protein
MLKAPGKTADRPSWRASMQSWRVDCIQSIGFNGSIFEEPRLKWTQYSYMQPQMHPYDRFFYNREEGYTVKKWLDDTVTRYGGNDGM